MKRLSPGTGCTDVVFEPTATPMDFYTSRGTWNGRGWDLARTDGTVDVCGDKAPLQAIRDRYGNQTTLTRTTGLYPIKRARVQEVPRRRSAIIQSLAVSVFLLLLQPVTTRAQEAKTGALWVVSIPHLELAPRERVVGFDVQIKTGTVVSLPQVPPAWQITIKHDLLWTARVVGKIEIGSAAFSDGEFFRNFLVVRKWTAQDQGGVSPPPFEIRVKITTTVDFEATKSRRFKKADLLLRKQ